MICLGVFFFLTCWLRISQYHWLPLLFLDVLEWLWIERSIRFRYWIWLYFDRILDRNDPKERKKKSKCLPFLHVSEWKFDGIKLIFYFHEMLALMLTKPPTSNCQIHWYKENTIRCVKSKGWFLIVKKNEMAQDANTEILLIAISRPMW